MRDLDDLLRRDDEREPTRLRTPTRRIALDGRGTLAREFISRGMSRHGAECSCRWCTEQPETEAALDVLRKAALL